MYNKQSLRVNNERRWTHADVEYLCEFASNKSVDELAGYLKQSTDSILDMIKQLNLNSYKAKRVVGTWSEKEIQILRDKWELMPIGEIAKLLNRPYLGVSAKAKDLHLPPKNKIAIKPHSQQFKPWRKWSIEDDKFICGNWATLTVIEIAKVLDRQVDVLKARAQKLGCRNPVSDFRNWNEQQRIDFISMWSTLSIKEVSILLGLPPVKLKKMASHFKLPTCNANRLKLWTEAELSYLKSNYKSQPQKITMQVLGRSKSAIEHKYAELMKDPEKTFPASRSAFWSEKEIKFLTENYLKQNSKTLAKSLDRPLSTVRWKLTQLGLRRSQEDINKVRVCTIDDISDSKATMLISHDPILRKTLLDYPELLKVKKAQFILNHKISNYGS